MITETEILSTLDEAVTASNLSKQLSSLKHLVLSLANELTSTKEELNVLKKKFKKLKSDYEDSSEAIDEIGTVTSSVSRELSNNNRILNDLTLTIKETFKEPNMKRHTKKSKPKTKHRTNKSKLTEEQRLKRNEYQKLFMRKKRAELKSKSKRGK